MTSIEQLRSLTAWDVTVILGALLATIAPGLLIIYLYQPALVKDLESVKLFALSASLTLPVVAVNAFGIAIIGPFVGSIGKSDSTSKHIFFWLSTWTFVTLYLGILSAYLCHLSVAQFIAVVGVIDILLGAIILWVMRFLVQLSS